ncbi:GntR family transcriptional regulator [Burkholderia sp. Ax-1724]|uniref:GntR family transcriptional regulator n=1 Tax=Burkholderia sp. Ax-1724 TaxID=2608336 RepID=UPI0014206D00|nr:GntR family transcriptional regulator [Burkholderia sp. Ax-1724]NIF54211.1 GntR family transcriptional regulator [Burkholderia sp. Ax-1724]
MATTSTRSRKKATVEAAELEVRDEKQHGSRSDYVYQMLRKHIESGELKPGDRVMEVEIAEQLEVSRTPVRDALRRLESDGMVVIEPRVGLRIASLSRGSILELYLMRELLEGTAAGLCATHATELELMELEELVRKEKSLQGDYEALARHNRRFHEAIYHGAHNRYLEKSLNAVNDSMWLLGRSLMYKPERAETAYLQHRELLETILARDSVTAEKLAREHIAAAKKVRLRALFDSQE